MSAPNMLDFHPARKFLEWVLWYHLGQPRSKRGIDYPKFKRGSIQFLRKEVSRVLMGPTQYLSSLLVKKRIHPKRLNPQLTIIPNGSLEIMYDPQIREFTEILTLLGHSAKDIADDMQALPYVREFTEDEVQGYRYYFWNMEPGDGWEKEHTQLFRTMLVNESKLSSMYERHLRLGFGETPRLQVAIDLGIDCPTDVILRELYRGFCDIVLHRNAAVRRGDNELVESWSRSLVRDTQVLRSMGFQPEKTKLSDSIQVTQDTPEI